RGRRLPAAGTARRRSARRRPRTRAGGHGCLGLHVPARLGGGLLRTRRRCGVGVAGRTRTGRRRPHAAPAGQDKSPRLKPLPQGNCISPGLPSAPTLRADPPRHVPCTPRSLESFAMAASRRNGSPMLEFTVLTLNTHQGFSALKRHFILAELREAVRTVSADVVCLQEVLGEHEPLSRRHADWPAVPHYEFIADTLWPQFAYG